MATGHDLDWAEQRGVDLEVAQRALDGVVGQQLRSLALAGRLGVAGDAGVCAGGVVLVQQQPELVPDRGLGPRVDRHVHRVPGALAAPVASGCRLRQQRLARTDLLTSHTNLTPRHTCTRAPHEHVRTHTSDSRICSTVPLNRAEYVSKFGVKRSIWWYHIE